MVFKIYTHPLSPNSHGVTVILKELQIPFEEIHVDIIGTKEQKSPEYLAKNPFGQVPAIDDNGFILYESRAIARYICLKYPQGAKFLPSGTEATALFEQMASVEMAQFAPTAKPLIFQKYFNPMFGTPTDEAIVAENTEKFNSILAVYDKILGKQKYLAGDQLTLVDFFHLPAGDVLERISLFSLEDKPNVTRWWKELSSRPSWQGGQGSGVRYAISTQGTTGMYQVSSYVRCV